MLPTTEQIISIGIRVDCGENVVNCVDDFIYSKENTIFPEEVI
jgi:hypothetical protein